MVDFLSINAISIILGIFALLMAKEVYILIKKGKLENKIDRIKSQVSELHKWHDVVNKDGVKVWYVREELYSNALRELSKVVNKNTEVLTALLTEIKVMVKVADRESKHR